ncbi:hypothetical protein L2K20_09695 [Mycobacterium sp. MBM]|nr:hypothetical protein [Mycobacterium sp. MBM]
MSVTGRAQIGGRRIDFLPFLVLGALLAATLVESIRLPRAAGAHVTGS